jgi:ElaB/YqjD/DUF883 family membrane-anchored ribosome-binding protein
MTTDTLDPEKVVETSGSGDKATSPFNDALATAQAKISETAKAAQKAIQENEALAAAQAKLAETAKAAQKAIQESEALSAAQAKVAEKAKAAQETLKVQADALMERTKVYRENAGEQFNDAQEYLVERIKERPVTAAFTGLGVGLILGLLLANRSR